MDVHDDFFCVGDQVLQIGVEGLGRLEGFHYVIGIIEGKLMLSRSPGGIPLKDLHDEPRLYTPTKFRRVIRAA